MTLPSYLEIITTLKLDPLRDKAAPHIIEQVLISNEQKLAKNFQDLLDSKFGGDRPRAVAIVGPGPSALRYAHSIKHSIMDKANEYEYEDLLVIIADSGLRNARMLGLEPDVIVTDLDGVGITELASMLKKGTYVALHVHGDNIDTVRSFLSLTGGDGKIVLTSQLREAGRFAISLRGFTDGDRAIGIGCLLSRERLFLIGMDFDIQPVPNKIGFPSDVFSRAKLSIAKRFAKEYVCTCEGKGISVSNFSYFGYSC